MYNLYIDVMVVAHFKQLVYKLKTCVGFSKNKCTWYAVDRQLIFQIILVGSWQLDNKPFDPLLE